PDARVRRFRFPQNPDQARPWGRADGEAARPTEAEPRAYLNLEDGDEAISCTNPTGRGMHVRPDFYWNQNWPATAAARGSVPATSSGTRFLLGRRLLVCSGQPLPLARRILDPPALWWCTV